SPQAKAWNSAGSAGVIDEDSVGKIAFQDFATRFISGQVGTGTVRYNITATKGISAFCPATTSAVNIQFRTSDTTGAHPQVKFDIHRTNILTGGNDVIFSFNSNGFPASPSFQAASFTPGIDFDFRNYIYWIEATVFRDDPAQFAELGGIQIYESAGSACP